MSPEGREEHERYPKSVNCGEKRFGDSTAEAPRPQSKEFLIKRYFELSELCVSAVKYFFDCGSAALWIAGSTEPAL
jgi:hypothetical protein